MNLMDKKVGDTFVDNGRIYEITKKVDKYIESKLISFEKLDIEDLPFTDIEVPKEYETPIIEEVPKEPAETYSKTDINRMNVAELKEVCTSLGIDYGEGVGTEMRRLIIRKLGL